MKNWHFKYKQDIYVIYVNQKFLGTVKISYERGLIFENMITFSQTILCQHRLTVGFTEILHIWPVRLIEHCVGS